MVWSTSNSTNVKGMDQPIRDNLAKGSVSDQGYKNTANFITGLIKRSFARQITRCDVELTDLLIKSHHEIKVNDNPQSIIVVTERKEVEKQYSIKIKGSILEGINPNLSFKLFCSTDQGNSKLIQYPKDLFPHFQIVDDFIANQSTSLVLNDAVFGFELREEHSLHKYIGRGFLLFEKPNFDLE